MSGQADAFIRRLDGADERLARLAVAESPRSSALTTADDVTGEQWEPGQVWAHVGELVGYWLREAAMVVREYRGEPVPFGRVQGNAARLDAIERDRGARPEAMLWEARDDISALREWLSGLSTAAWQARGVHETRGVMSLDSLLEEFIVGHLEEHATQLEEVLRTARP